MDIKLVGMYEEGNVVVGVDALDMNGVKPNVVDFKVLDIIVIGIDEEEEEEENVVGVNMVKS